MEQRKEERELEVTEEMKKDGITSSSLIDNENGGNYFSLKINGEIVKEVLVRDCIGMMNNCDYETIIIDKEGGLKVHPIFDDWLGNFTSTMYHKFVTNNKLVRT
jgi:hypothetical protein